MKKIIILFLIVLFLSFNGYPEKKQKQNKKQTKTSLEEKDFLKKDGFYRKKRLGRATLEFLTLMGYWQTRYWLIYSQFIEDWQFELTFKDQLKRLHSSEAYRLDSNCYSLNWLHSIAGAGFYTVARSNYYGWGKSLLFAIAGSAYWEYIVEWREVISFNDMIVTPIGGFSMGEAMFQTSDYFSSKKGLFNQILSFITSPVSRINRWIDRKKSPIRLNRTGWRRNYFSFAKESVNNGDNKSSLTYFGFDNELITIPEYGKDGEFYEYVDNTLYGRFFVSLTYGKDGLEDVDILTKTIFTGLFSQSIKNRKGYSLTLGLGSRFDFYLRRGTAFYDSCDAEVDDGKSLELEKPREFKDKHTIVNIVGPVIDYSLFNKDFRIKFNFESYFDFALMNSFAINEYSKYFDISKVKTTLLYYGYYYGYGFTIQSGIEAEYKGLIVKASARYSAYRSIQGLDRFQDKITDDFLLKDWLKTYSFKINYRIGKTPFEIFLSLFRRERKGKIFSLITNGHDSRLTAGINILL